MTNLDKGFDVTNLKVIQENTNFQEEIKVEIEDKINMEEFEISVVETVMNELNRIETLLTANLNLAQINGMIKRLKHIGKIIDISESVFDDGILVKLEWLAESYNAKSMLAYSEENQPIIMVNP